MEVKIKIPGYDDRSEITSILAQNGIKTWVECEEKNHSFDSDTFYVVFETTPPSD